MNIKNRNSEATFRVFQRDDKSFAIEVEIPEVPPTIVSSFDTAQAAELWIDAFKERVTASQSRRPAYFRDRTKVATEA
jgi:hypothetical protein